MRFRKVFKRIVKVLLTICIASFVAIMEVFKSKRGIICLESALVAFIAIYFIFSLKNGTSQKGKFLAANKWRKVCPWLEVIWIGAVLGLNFVLIEQILTMILN